MTQDLTAPPPSDETPSDDLIGLGRDILVVDDNANNLVAIEAALEPLGRKLILVRSGVEALQQLLRQDFALILLDVQMPVMDGFETARLLRSRERYRSTPIIFITGVTWPEDTDLRGYQLGAFDFLMKPIRPEVLRAKASVFIQLQERTLELHRKSEELRQEQLRTHEREMQKASETQFQLMADMLPILAWYADPDGSVPWRNQRWYDYTGLQPGEPVQRRDWLDPEEAPRVLAKWDKALAKGEPWEDTFRMRRADGTYRWFLSRAVPMRDRSGRIVRWFGSNVDINHQKSLEENTAAASRAKDEFLAMLGHELRNPLAPILTALDLMKLSIPHTAERERTVIERQVKHLVRLVDDLLDISRITQGKIELKRERVELAEVVGRGVELASPLLERKEHALTVEVAEQGMMIEGDPTRLSQVIANVLNNSAKYTEPGGTISIRALRIDDRFSLRIKDSGIGISPTMLRRVFELFSQEQQTVDRAQGGLGLGLAIARSIVQMHRGTISAYSEGLGRGSEFIIELPAARRHSRQLTAPLPEPLADAAGKRGQRILVVDDNADATELLAELLRKLGHEVEVALDGPSALATVQSFVPDVAVLDIGLPVMDGYELLTQMKTKLEPCATRFIAVTGYGQADDKRRSEQAGFHLHLVKPISVKQVQNAILQVMAARDAEGGAAG